LQSEDAGEGGTIVRETDGVTKVKFPIRLGDHRQLNDGLLGYWIEHEEKDVLYKHFHSGNEPALERAVDDGAAMLTMLVDPRGVVHLTSGILPAEALEIPHDQYAAALQAIEVTFLTAPILSPAGKIELPLPVEADHAWSWVRDRTAAPSAVGPASPQASWGDPLEIHDGWLRLTNSSNAGKG